MLAGLSLGAVILLLYMRHFKQKYEVEQHKKRHKTVDALKIALHITKYSKAIFLFNTIRIF
jgi:hypothetical protein